MTFFAKSTIGVLSVASCATLLFSFTSCRSSDEKSTSTPTAAGTGCIQGVVVDGLTGKRIELPASSKSEGVNVLVRNEMRGASLMTEAVPADKSVQLTDAQKELAGEYNICDIPADQAFPVFAWVDGYAAYESLVTVHSTTKAQSPNAREDVIRAYPTELINIRLFPKNQQVKDLLFQISHNGTAVKDAVVRLRPTGQNFLSPDGSLFLPPFNARQLPLSVTTDAAGKAVFAAKDLVLGGRYSYVVLPPDGGSSATVAGDEIVVGLHDMNLASADPASGKFAAPYLVRVDLKNTVTGVHELSRSTDSGDPDPSGELIVYFDREIEIVAGTFDGITATLSGNVTAALKANQVGNDQSEQVKIRTDGNMLVLTPNFERLPATDTSTELQMTILYSGIILRAKESPETGVPLPPLENSVVKFYR